MRKHKRDDYGGMYRVWILMSGMFLLASVDCAVDLRSITAKLFEFLTLRSLLQAPWLLMTIEMIVLGIIVIRMLFEVRASKFSLAAVLLVWLGFVGCIVLRNAEVPSDIAWLDQKTAYGNCILLGCVGSLTALTIYARFVFLHAHGLIQLKVKKPKPKSTPATESKQKKVVKTKPATSEKKSKKKAAKQSDQPVAEPTTATTAAPWAASKVKPAAPKAKTTAPKEKAAAPKEKPISPLAQKQRQAKAAQVAAQSAAPARQQDSVDQEQRKAAAREKVAQQRAAAQQKAAAQAHEDSEDADTIPLSKSERRRQRKLAKRAARGKKAA